MFVGEKSVIKTDEIFSEDKQHRFLLRKEWNKTKKKAMVIMINPRSAAKVDNIIIAWGKAGETNNKIYNRQKEVIEILKPHIEKIYVIEDEQGSSADKDQRKLFLQLIVNKITVGDNRKIDTIEIHFNETLKNIIKSFLGEESWDDEDSSISFVFGIAI